MTAPKRIVVVGASLAGLCAAQELRRLGFGGQLCLIGDEAAPPYDRPALTKQVLTSDLDLSDLLLADETELGALDLDLRLGRRATALDLAERAVVLAGGRRVPFDAVVLATGAHARRPPFLGDLDGVHTLRTISDALAIRDALEGREKAVVIGAGFIGAEVAASLRTRGMSVTMVDPLAGPLAAVVGRRVGHTVAELHRRSGTTLELGVAVARVEGRGRVQRVVLADGRILRTDLVVAGLGSRPTTDWLEESGLPVHNGVVCDEHGWTGVPGVYAIGDVARWRDAVSGRHVRGEHWSNARLQAGVVAENLIAGAPIATLPSLPTFWTDQYDWRIQLIGSPTGSDDIRVVEGRLDQDRFVVLYGRHDRVTGALAVNSTRGLVKQYALVADGGPWSAVAAASSMPE